jgi:predicted RNA-binding protein
VIHIKVYGDRIEMVDILNQGKTVEGQIIEYD